MTNPRQPRFTRHRASKIISISDRALSILRGLARFRFLNRDQIIALLDIEQDVYGLPPVSHQKVLRLLQKLYLNNYVERILGPVTNLTEFSAVRRLPTTYALAQNGATHLTLTDRVALDHLDWREKNTRVGSPHIAHTTGIATFVIALLSAAKKHGLNLIDHHDLLGLAPGEAATVALTLSVLADGIEYTRRPDRLLALVDATGQRYYFAHEWHSGEIPGARNPDALWRGYRQSNFAETIWIYWQARNAGAFKKLWDAGNLRVLTVTANDESIVNLSRQVARITGRPLTKLFLFTTPARLFREHPLAPIWYSPQHAFDPAEFRYSVKALQHATPISIIEPGLSLANNPP